MKFDVYVVIFLLIAGCQFNNSNLQESNVQQKVLFICTSEAEFNGFVNGTYLEEIAIPIYEFRQNDIDIDIASPEGGAIPIYYKFDTTEVLQQAIVSEYYLQKVANSMPIHEVNIEKYSAIIIPGGYGQFIDLHENEQLKKLIVDHHEQGGIIGTIGHGTAILASLKLENGSFLVEGVTMTCFPNWNEQNIMEEADKGRLLPFLMQSELEKNGAILKIYDHEQKINHEIIDEQNKVVTAAFASGGSFVANQVMEMMDAGK